MNKPITPLLLIDFVLREENKFKNKHGIEVGSFEPEQVYLFYVLKYDRDGYIWLWTKDFHAEKMISYFNLKTLKDLKGITPRDLWDAYLDGKGMLRCGICDEQHELDFRIVKGQTRISCQTLGYNEKTDELIDTFEKAEAYLMKHFEALLTEEEFED